MKHRYPVCWLLIALVLILPYGVGLTVGVQEITVSNDSTDLYLTHLADAIEKTPWKLREIADPNGFVLLRTFLSGYGDRGTEVLDVIKPSQIPKNLKFNLVKNERPISLKTEFQGIGKSIKKVQKHKTNVVFNWNELVKPVVLNNLGMLSAKEDQYEGVKVYALKDGSFCLASFAGSGLQYSRWTVFRKISDRYYLKILQL